LNFDDDEALLAIVSVCAFSIVLIDQITERLSFERAKLEATTRAIEPHPDQPLVERVFELLKEFISQFNKSFAHRKDVREATLTGALAGFLSTSAPSIHYQIEALLAHGISQWADVMLSEGSERLIIEVKLLPASPAHVEAGMLQLSTYMSISGVDVGILFMVSIPNSGNLVKTKYETMTGTIHVISTET
jgi:hypothetical protein